MKDTLKVGTLNVNSLIRSERKAWLRGCVFENDIDIICIQETKISSVEKEIELVEAFKEWFYVFHASGVNGSAGTAVMVRKRSKIVVVDCELEQNGRVAVVDCLWCGDLVRVISVYAPNECAERKLFFETSVDHFANTDSKVIMAGDFNCVVRRDDCTYKEGRRDSSVTQLKRLIHDQDLLDVGLGNNTTIKYTHWQGTSHARLDRIYVSGDLCPDTAEYKVTPIAFTDHALVTIWLKKTTKNNDR